MVMNEIERVRNLLEKGDFSENTYNFNKEIRLLIRYFISEGDSIIEEILEKIINILEEKIPNFNTWEWEDSIESKIKQEFKNETDITEIESVYITRGELEEILSLKTAFQRKFLFTCMIYDRYNSLSKNDDKERFFGTTMKMTKEILKSANVNGMENKRQHIICKELLDLGKLERALSYGSLGLKVKCFHDTKDEEERKTNKEFEKVIEVTSFEDLGKFIEEYINPILKERKEEAEKLEKKKKLKEMIENGYKVCEVCGKPYKPKAKDYRSTKCNTCKKVTENEQAKERMKKMREKAKKE